MLFRRVPVTYTTGVGGDVAQLGERRTRIAEVVGSNPIVSTRNSLMDAGFVGPTGWWSASGTPKWYSMVLCETRFAERGVGEMAVMKVPGPVSADLYRIPLENLKWADVDLFLKQDLPESEILEYKSDFSDGVTESIASMANTQGGLILVGVAEAAKTKRPVAPAPGVKRSHFDQGTVGNHCAAKLQPLYVPLHGFAEFPHDLGKGVLVIKVEPGKAPIPLWEEGHGILIRVGDQNRPADLHTLETFFSAPSAQRRASVLSALQAELRAIKSTAEADYDEYRGNTSTPRIAQRGSSLAQEGMMRHRLGFPWAPLRDDSIKQAISEAALLGLTKPQVDRLRALSERISQVASLVSYKVAMYPALIQADIPRELTVQQMYGPRSWAEDKAATLNNGIEAEIYPIIQECKAILETWDFKSG